MGKRDAHLAFLTTLSPDLEKSRFTESDRGDVMVFAIRW
jgi:hypothetical protein